MPIKKKSSSLLDEIEEDLCKPSVIGQIILGASTGFLTGFSLRRTNPYVATGIGGSVVILNIANEAGYIHLNWDKVQTKVDKVGDKIGKEVTGKGPTWADKAERFVDRKLDKVEEILDKKLVDRKTIKPIHYFMTSFTLGCLLSLTLLR